jgi:hypothetical protein
MKKTLILFGFIIVGCSSPHDTKESETGLIHATLINNQWKLISPEPKKDCDLKLFFANNNEMQMSYRGKEYEGVLRN